MAEVEPGPRVAERLLRRFLDNNFRQSIGAKPLRPATEGIREIIPCSRRLNPAEVAMHEPSAAAVDKLNADVRAFYAKTPRVLNVRERMVVRPNKDG